MEKYKSLNRDSRIPGLQHMKVPYPQRLMEDMHDVVPDMIYSPMMDFEKTFLCQMCNKFFNFFIFVQCIFYNVKILLPTNALFI